MIKKIVLSSLILCAIVGCEKKPDVPPISDIENIVIDGQKMTADEYWNKFCKLKFETDNTCLNAKKKSKLEASRRALDAMMK